MIKRKAGVYVRISDVFRKRAFLGVAIFCITAIATVGALSIGGKEKEETPDSLVDLNETKEQSEPQVAEDDKKQPEDKQPEIQVGENTEPSGTDSKEPGALSQTEVAEKPKETPKETPKEEKVKEETPKEEKPLEVAEKPEEKEEPEQKEVLSPQLIAEQLSFNKSDGLLWPIDGQVIIPYSPDHGVYHFTLDQFSTSEAMVLSSKAGTPVKAAAKGVVTSISEDVRTGTTVTLALGNNVSLVYGQLELSDLKEGDVLEAGECVGTVANPTRYYVIEGPNLYFKVLENGESIDPSELLKVNQ